MTLAAAFEAYAADTLARDTSTRTRVLVQRAFMAGALEAVTSKQPREALLAEIVSYGRAIGTAAERATP